MTTKSKLDYVPSHKMNGKFAVLQQFSLDEAECWLTFISVENNEENLKFLQEQLESIEWYASEDWSCFDIDLDNYVSATTAKEMTKIDLNSVSFHRKFDGVLKRIDFKFKKKMSNTTKMSIVNDKIGMGSIDRYIDDEDIDEEDLVTDSEGSGSNSESSDSEENESSGAEKSDDSDDDDDEKDVSEEVKTKKEELKNKVRLPPSVVPKTKK